MVTVSELIAWQPTQLSSVVDALLVQRRELTDLQDEINDARPPYTWMSGAADNARREHERLRLRLLDLVAEVSKVATSVDFAEVEIQAACTRLDEVLSQAEAD